MAGNLPADLKEREYYVTLPRRDNDDHPIDAEVLERLVKQFAGHFEGVTIWPNTGGCYVVGEKYGGGLQCEENLIIMAVRQDPAKFHGDNQFVKTSARSVGHVLGQESIMEQEEFATRTWFRKGKRESSLPTHLLQGDRMPPANTFTRLLYGG